MPERAMTNWTWPNGARLALSLVVNVEEGAEFNVRDGDRGPEPVDELGIVLKKEFGLEVAVADPEIRDHFRSVRSLAGLLVRQGLAA